MLAGVGNVLAEPPSESWSLACIDVNVFDLWTALTIDVRRSHGALIVEERAALPLDGGVKCRQPERVEDGWIRSVPRGETGQTRKDVK